MAGRNITFAAGTSTTNQTIALLTMNRDFFLYLILALFLINLIYEFVAKRKAGIFKEQGYLRFVLTKSIVLVAIVLIWIYGVNR